MQEVIDGGLAALAAAGGIGADPAPGTFKRRLHILRRAIGPHEQRHVPLGYPYLKCAPTQRGPKSLPPFFSCLSAAFDSYRD